MTNALVKSFGPTSLQDGMAVQQPVIQLAPVTFTDTWSQDIYGSAIYSSGMSENVFVSGDPALSVSVSFTTGSGRVGTAMFVTSASSGGARLMTMRVTLTGTTTLSGVPLGNGCWLVDPGSPPTPGYWTTREVLSCVFLPADYSWLPPEIQQGILAGKIIVPPSGSGGPGTLRVCSLVSTQFFVDPQPARAPTEFCESGAQQDFKLGWNAGARSVQRVNRGARIQWTVGGTMVGAIVGFEDTVNGVGVPPGIEAGSSLVWQSTMWTPQPINDISFANTFMRGRLTLVGGQIQVFSSEGSTYVGNYVAGDVLKLERTKTKLQVFKNDVQQGVDYPLTSYRPTNMVAMLYAGGDYIDVPSITALADAGAGLMLAPPIVLGGVESQQAGSGPTVIVLPPGSDDLIDDGWVLPGTPPNGEALAAVLSGLSVLLPLVAIGGEFPNKLVMHPLAISAWEDYQAGAALTLPRLTMAASAGYAGPEPSYALAALYLLPLNMFAVSATSGTGSGELTMRELEALGADRLYGAGVISLPRLQMFGFAEAANEATIGGALFAGSTVAGDPIIVVTMTSEGSIASVLAVQVLVDAAASSTMDIASTLASTELVNALLHSLLSIGADVPLYEQPVQSWVLNTTNLASSTYEGFEFNSFGMFDGRYIGARSDGLYLLEGDDDAGVPIKASLSLGKQNFGSTTLKRPEYAYIGVATTGDVFVKVIDQNGAEWLYRASRTSETLETQRVKFGRGLRASYFTFEVYNADGGDIDINTIEFRIAELSRRI